MEGQKQGGRVPAKGRARGRAADRPQQAPAPQQEVGRQAAEQRQQQQVVAPPPGMTAAQVAPPVVGASAQVSGDPAHAGGRASTAARGTRGGAQRPGGGGDDPEGGAVGELAGAVGGMGIRSRAGAGEPRGRRRGALGINYDEPVTRPSHITVKTGDSGTPISVVSNLFRLNRKQQFAVYQYHVEFKPAVDNMKMRKGMINQIADIIGPIHMFDGMQLFLPIQLERNPQTAHVKRKSDDAVIEIEMKRTGIIPPTSPTCMQLYNIVFKKVLFHIGMQLVGRNYYNPTMAVDIERHNLQVWPGFVTSILNFEKDTHLIADLSHKILSTMTILKRMYQIYKPFETRGGQGVVMFQELAMKEIVGQIVLTRYNNKTYRVDDIDWTKRPSSTFKRRDGTEETLLAYYKRAHDIDIKDPDQPMLVSMPKKRDQRAGQTEPILLIPELCTMTGLAEEVRTNFNIMRDLAVHTRIDPNGRVTRLREFLDKIKNTPEAQTALNRWNMELADDLLEIAARVLPVEKITMGAKNRSPSFVYDPKSAEWSREMRNLTLLGPKSCQNWVMVFLQRDQKMASDMFDALKKVGGPMGMQFANPTTVELQNDQTASYINGLKTNCRPGTDFVLCLLPTNRKDRYDAIKTYLCVENPIPSQMILTKTLSKPQMVMSVCTKVAIQINCKLGGECWAVDIPMGGTMIVGIDTYHDSAQKNRSVVGMVASLNRTFSRWYTRWNFQSTHEELGSGLQVAMNQCVKKFAEVNGSLPTRIIVFRDGVGDGQLNMVTEYELPQIKKGFEPFGIDYKPQLAMIVVTKRVNSRFFGKQSGPRGMDYFNPPPGTLIDNGATRPEWYDFFIVSQSVRQGTVTPTHYNIIHDTTTLKPDHMQRLAYKLCHLYYNWPGTIRVPAPCQYAHKMAFLVGQSIHRDPHLSLADKLFYL